MFTAPFIYLSLFHKQLLVDHEVLILENVKNNSNGAFMLIKPVPNGFHRDLSRPLIWEHKNTGGNTAKGYTFKAVLRCQIQARSVA